MECLGLLFTFFVASQRRRDLLVRQRLTCSSPCLNDILFFFFFFPCHAFLGWIEPRNGPVQSLRPNRRPLYHLVFRRTWLWVVILIFPFSSSSFLTTRWSLEIITRGVVEESLLFLWWSLASQLTIRVGTDQVKETTDNTLWSFAIIEEKIQQKIASPHLHQHSTISFEIETGIQFAFGWIKEERERGGGEDILLKIWLSIGWSVRSSSTQTSFFLPLPVLVLWRCKVI